MYDLQFNHAALLGLLVPILLLIAALWYGSLKATLASRLAYGDERLYAGRGKRLTLRSQIPALVAWLLTAVLLITAAAGPTLPRAPEHARAGSLQVIVAFDVSKSMFAEDYSKTIPQEWLNKYFGAHGNRLDKAKHVVQTQLMPAIDGNRVGFVTYKGEGFAQAELTDDYAALNWVLENWVRVGNAPGGGSNFANGLSEAIAMFKRADEDPNAQRVIVLFSDGGFTGDAQHIAAVLDELQKENIRLVVLGLGLSSAAPVPLYDPMTNKFTGYYKEDGKQVSATIDEAQLRQLAAITGGEYHRVQADGVDDINWPRTLGGRDKVSLERSEVFRYPLGAAFAVLCILGLSTIARPQALRSWRPRLRRRERDVG